jgi:hypothetical protein
MRRFASLPALVALLAAVAPVLAEEGDPLANSMLLPGSVGAAMAAVAGVLVLVFFFLARRARR